MLSGMDHAGTGMLHHIELWVPDLTRAEASWGWLLGKMGYHVYQEWPEGKSWRAGVTYIVIEQSPDRVAGLARPLPAGAESSRLPRRIP